MTAMISCYNPATREPLGEVPVDDPAAVGEAIRRARAAQVTWGAASPRRRAAVLSRILEHLLDHADELVEIVVRDAGKTREHAIMGEIWPVAEKLRWTIAHGPGALADEPVASGLLVHKRARIRYLPLGVVGVICPWNYPLQNVLGPTISALIAGNGVVCKVSEWVAWSSARIQRIFDEALGAEGFSPDLVRLVNGYGETGAALVRGGVDIVVFTGSVPNGRRVIAGSAEPITPVILELGGKDPMILCEDADLDLAAASAMAGVFINAGQNCLSSERLLVNDAVYDAFVARMTEQVQALRQGPPLGPEQVDVGAIISPLQLELIAELVEDARAKGARILAGGRVALPEVGQYYAPTLIADATPEMRIMTEETFGPVMVISRVRDDAHALELANSTPFGLSSTVFSRDPARAAWFAERLQAGSTLVNDFGLNYMIQGLPFGGVKASGFGRLNGVQGIRALCNAKAVVEDRVAVGVPTKVFPAAPGDYATYKAAIEAIYRPALAGKVRGAGQLLRAWMGRA
jgi:acyl-CoA reductase-like NAD-dependent aldehyde dehydrogenase